MTLSVGAEMQRADNEAIAQAGERLRAKVETNREVGTGDNDQAATVQPRAPRHPARVTFDRLVDDLEKYREQLTPREIAAAELILRGLDAVADGLR